VLRLWRAPARLADGAPLWIGATQALSYEHPLGGLFGIWLPVNDDTAAHAAVARSLTGFPMRQAPHPQTMAPVLRVRTDPQALRDATAPR
jgi:hypothetical protein